MNQRQQGAVVLRVIAENARPVWSVVGGSPETRQSRKGPGGPAGAAMGRGERQGELAVKSSMAVGGVGNKRRFGGPGLGTERRGARAGESRHVGIGEKVMIGS